MATPLIARVTIDIGKIVVDVDVSNPEAISNARVAFLDALCRVYDKHVGEAVRQGQGRSRHGKVRPRGVK